MATVRTFSAPHPSRHTSSGSGIRTAQTRLTTIHELLKVGNDGGALGLSGLFFSIRLVQTLDRNRRPAVPDKGTLNPFEEMQMKATHYLGLHGRNGESSGRAYLCGSASDAVSALSSRFHLSAARKIQLVESHFAGLKLTPQGVEYVEVFSCSCDAPSAHIGPKDVDRMGVMA